MSFLFDRAVIRSLLLARARSTSLDLPNKEIRRSRSIPVLLARNRALHSKSPAGDSDRDRIHVTLPQARTPRSASQLASDPTERVLAWGYKRARLARRG